MGDQLVCGQATKENVVEKLLIFKNKYPDKKNIDYDFKPSISEFYHDELK